MRDHTGTHLGEVIGLQQHAAIGATQNWFTDLNAAERDGIYQTVFGSPSAAWQQRVDQLSTEELLNEVKIRSERPDGKAAAIIGSEELIERADARLPDNELPAAVKDMAIFLEALRRNKEVYVALDGVKFIDDRIELTEARRYYFHHEIANSIYAVADQFQNRDGLIELLADNGLYESADKLARETCRKADGLLKPIEAHGKSVSFMDIVKEEAQLVFYDARRITNPSYRNELWQILDNLGFEQETSVSAIPINAYTKLASLALRAQFHQDLFDRNRFYVSFGEIPGFSTDTAYAAADKIRDYSQQIYGFDPADPEEALRHPAAPAFPPDVDFLNITLDANNNGKSDLIQSLEVESDKNSIGKLTSDPDWLGAIGWVYPGATRLKNSMLPAEDKPLLEQRFD